MDGSHIVLDLDDTLIHAIFIDDTTSRQIETDNKYKYLKGRSKIIRVVDINDNDTIGNGIISNILVILRPGVKEFMMFVMEYFDNVTIWSAGNKRYVRALESVLIDPSHEMYKKNKIKVLSRGDCNEITKKSVLKDLKSKGFDLTKTIMIDDNKTTYVNNPDNAINIPGYNPEFKEEHINFPDTSLKDIKKWMLDNNIKNCKDVRELDKTKIFKKTI
jgi:TFIIF-interacting CTD phosphatase-like protein